MLGRASGENECGDVRAGLRVAHHETGFFVRKRRDLVERHISAGCRPIEAPVAVKPDRDWFAGRNHGVAFVRGNSCQGKHFWVKRATFLCTAAYLSKTVAQP